LRQEAIDRETERMEKKQEELEAAKTAFEEAQEAAEQERLEKEENAEEGATPPELPQAKEFNMEEFEARFDDENPPIDIPEEVVEDVDNDYNLEPPEPEEK